MRVHVGWMFETRGAEHAEIQSDGRLQDGAGKIRQLRFKPA